MADIKLKDILKELDLPPPTVKFEVPPRTTQVHQQQSHQNKPEIYTNKSIDFSNKNTPDPTFAEYKAHFIKYEGKKNNTYIDSRGFKTVGIGHKFEKGEPMKSTYTNAEIDHFFKKDLDEAISDTKKVFPTFNTLPKEVKLKLVSLTFNLGKGGIEKFKDFRAAILSKNWKNAAKELVDSKWYKQTGNRARDYVNFFNDLV
jgi:lysozyme